MFQSLSFALLENLPIFLGQASETAPTGSGTPPASGPDSIMQVLMSPFGFMLIAMSLLYFMVLLPQQRQSKNAQRELAESLKNLKKNDRVVTVGGIHGTVLIASGDAPTVTIRIDDATNAKMTVNREAIMRVIVEETKPE